MAQGIPICADLLLPIYILVAQWYQCATPLVASDWGKEGPGGWVELEGNVIPAMWCGGFRAIH